MKGFYTMIMIAIMVLISNHSYTQGNRRDNDQRDNHRTDEQRDSRYDEHQSPGIKGELMMRLEKLERDFSARINRRDRYELQRQIDEIKQLIRQLPSENVQMPPLMPVSEVEFQQLLNSVKKEHFSDGKIQIITSARNYNFFTVDQVIDLANTSPFGDDKIEIIKILYPKILNYDKTYLLYSCLKFDSEKKKLEQFIKDFERQNDNRSHQP